MRATRLTIDEMHCQRCVEHVAHALAAVPGIRVQAVHVGSAEVEIDPGQSSTGEVLAALEGAGYPARVN